MIKRLFRHSLPILALSVVPMAIAAMPAQAAPAPGSSVHFYGSCGDIRRHLVKAPDGDYLLYNNGNLFTVYCDDMSSNMPREYIDLVKTGYGANFSQYTAGGASPGTNVRTMFKRLRINPASLTVDIGDLTFASSTGSLMHSGTVKVTSMPYGVAMSCTAPQAANGTGNIDLRYTPFQVNRRLHRWRGQRQGLGHRHPGQAAGQPGRRRLLRLDRTRPRAVQPVQPEARNV